MKNIINVQYNSNNIEFLCLENIENGTDSIILRIKSNVDPVIVNEEEYEVIDGVATVNLNLSEITEQTFTVTIFESSITIYFYNFNTVIPIVLSNVRWRTMRVNYVNDTLFHVNLIAAVTTTDIGVGDGFTLNDYGDLEIDVSDGIIINDDGALEVDITDDFEFDEDGKLSLKSVESIYVTESNDLVSNVSIEYTDGSTNSYNCTYDANKKLTRFGNIPITWS